ncbi:MAG: DNA recombination protein RmuC [Acidaminococcus sp.]|jgi:DNA recombination protein RmuC|nr:DNA recombination protein RmuC [Acidaminococcus sp.]MCI2116751.1 DNA recombination protein RmuC [Acidaminococcus sp.]
MQTLLLAALLGALIITIIFLWQFQRTLRERENWQQQASREEAEKLRTSLDQKVTLSMSVVSDRLQQVSRSLGTLQSLSQNVGDLKKVMSNVKNRGIWGEMQLGQLLSDMLAPDQYGTNVAIRPRSQERVEFAIRLPGQDAAHPIWLPIDSKLPQEDYARLLEAREKGDADGETDAVKKLTTRVTAEARDIRDKYIAPPYSTDFGVMYLPLEGLFAEVVSIPGLISELQRKYRVTVAGPSTLAALLNSLQMGFRTLTIQRATSQVWQFVTRIRNDMETFDAAVDKARKKLDEAQKALEIVSQRSKILNQHLERAEKFTSRLDKSENNE